MRMQRLTFETQLAVGDVAQSRESAFVRNADFDLPCRAGPKAE